MLFRSGACGSTAPSTINTRKRQQEHKPIEVTRPAGAALQELAPANHFYTHSRQFDIQQIAIGNHQQPIIDSWAICGSMRAHAPDRAAPAAGSRCLLPAVRP